jgi:hypothetical protein
VARLGVWRLAFLTAGKAEHLILDLVLHLLTSVAARWLYGPQSDRLSRRELVTARLLPIAATSSPPSLAQRQVGSPTHEMGRRTVPGRQALPRLVLDSTAVR